MAIKIVKNENDMVLTIDNGDRQAFDDVMKKYHFISEQELIRFTLVVLLRAEKNGVYIEENNQRVFMSPSREITNPPIVPSTNPPVTPPNNT